MSRPGGKGLAGEADAIGPAVERLYAAPLDAFVALRKALAASLRSAGDVTSSRVVAKLAKPSRTAWALNQVARHQPALLREALDAREHAAAAQSHPAASDGDVLRATARGYREKVGEVVRAATAVARAAGMDLSPVQARRIGATLQTIAGGGDEAKALRDDLLGGRLAVDLDDDDPFAGMVSGHPFSKTSTASSAGAHAPNVDRARGERKVTNEDDSRHAATRALAVERERKEKATRAAAVERERKERDAKERGRRIAEFTKARARVVELEEEAKGARASARELEVAATRAQGEADRARRAVQTVEKRLEEARRDARKLGTEG